VTNAAVEILNAKLETVRIRFDEIEKEDVANAGVLESDRHP